MFLAITQTIKYPGNYKLCCIISIDYYFLFNGCRWGFACKIPHCAKPGVSNLPGPLAKFMFLHPP